MYIIAGIYRHRRLITPKGKETRPTASRLRESLFNICQNYIEGTRFLDLFAGSGAMGFEALSRGAESIVFVDQSAEAIRCIKRNSETLQVESKIQIFQGDIFRILSLLEKQKQRFDIIYADPPYHSSSESRSGNLAYSEATIRWIDQSQLLLPGGSLFVEEDYAHQPSLDDLTHLQLKDGRKMGHSALQHYILL